MSQAPAPTSSSTPTNTNAPPSLHGLTPSQFQLLKETALRAKANAYCPYSNFRVGASLLTTGGRCIAGSNVENAAYPAGNCAERTAMATAVAGGLRRGAFVALGVATDTRVPAAPCGMCRQFVGEFCGGGVPVFMFGEGARWEVLTVGELLPRGFGRGELGGGGGEEEEEGGGKG